jgi:hypothetical protein
MNQDKPLRAVGCSEPEATVGDQKWHRDGSHVWQGGNLVTDVVTAYNAEQKRADDSIIENVRQQNEIAELREQLAAERESHEKELDAVEANWSAEVQQLREQVAAEREKRGKAEAQARAEGGTK